MLPRTSLYLFGSAVDVPATTRRRRAVHRGAPLWGTRYIVLRTDKREA